MTLLGRWCVVCCFVILTLHDGTDIHLRDTPINAKILIHRVIHRQEKEEEVE
jgi:hypothetical protein